jgi:hypothetical protein
MLLNSSTSARPDRQASTGIASLEQQGRAVPAYNWMQRQKARSNNDRAHGIME